MYEKARSSSVRRGAAAMYEEARSSHYRGRDCNDGRVSTSVEGRGRGTCFQRRLGFEVWETCLSRVVQRRCLDAGKRRTWM